MSDDKTESVADGASVGDQIAAASRRLELQDPDIGLGLIDRNVNRLVEVIGVAVLCTIVATIFSNGIARYVFNVSFTWAEELVLLLAPWLAMTGVFLSVRRGTMIRIEFFFDKLPASVRAYVNGMGYIINIGVLSFMAWISYDFFKLFGHDMSPSLDIATGWSSSALMFGTGGAALAFVFAFHRERQQRQTLEGRDAS